LVSYLVARCHQISLIRKKPALLLDAPALLPLDRFAAEGRKPDDLYLFAFFLGLLAASHADVDRAMAAGQTAYFHHPLPDE
jgi:hypothetical protein